MFSFRIGVPCSTSQLPESRNFQDVETLFRERLTDQSLFNPDKNSLMFDSMQNLLRFRLPGEGGPPLKAYGATTIAFNFLEVGDTDVEKRHKAVRSFGSETENTNGTPWSLSHENALGVGEI